MTLDETTLDHHLTALEETRAWSPRLIARLEALLRAEDELKLVHVNPLAFAREHRVSESEAIDLFLHAAKLGLFDMQWRVVCPACGLSLDSFSSLRRVEARLYCDLCHATVETRLDDFIQVAFTVSARVRRVAFHDPTSLSAADYFFKYRFAAEALLPDGKGRMRDVMGSMATAAAYVEPKASLTIAFDAVPGFVNAADPVSHAGFLLPVTPERAEAPQRLRARLEAGRMTVDAVALCAGPVVLEVENTQARRGALLVACVPEAKEATVPAFEPFLTGGRVLTQQSFRKLFRSEVIQASEGIGVRELTVLFTDLKGSTALYERIGDLAAFTLVREHFELLAEVVQAYEGAVVKTIGDAVMAVFHDPERALKAAGKMLEAIEATDLVLKIGLHRGPSIAVTLNDNVDYFGQTVNVAARVQALADGGEICFTETIREHGGQLSDCEVTSRKETVKGLDREVTVFAARRAPAKAAA